MDICHNLFFLLNLIVKRFFLHLFLKVELVIHQKVALTHSSTQYDIWLR